MLADLFERVAEALSGVVQVLTEASDVQTVPRICWVPGSDTFGPPRLSEIEDEIAGQHVHAIGVAQRMASVELQMHVAAGSTAAQGQRAIDDLIRLTCVALQDASGTLGTSGCPGNVTLDSGRPMPRGSVLEGQVGYSLRVTVNIPIYRTTPAADARSASFDGITVS